MGRNSAKYRSSRGDNARVFYADIIAMLKWMRLKKFHLQIRNFPGTGRGVQSRKEINVGDELISLPFHLLVTTAVYSEVFVDIDVSKLSPQLVLSIFLMYERHLSKESKYWHYINLLPTHYSTLFFCSGNEIEALPIFMKEAVFEKIKELEDLYKKTFVENFTLCRHCNIELKEIFTYSDFIWAWFTVNTRSVYFKDELRDSLALAPFLDMFNHSFDANTELHIDYERKLYVLKSLNQYKKRRQIFIRYGFHSNWKLLFEYGFIQDDNPHDSVEFSFGEILTIVKSFRPEYGDIDNKKYKFIMNNNLHKNLFKSKSEYSWNINALLYVIVTKDENLAQMNAKCYSNEFTSFEWENIKDLQKILIRMKREQLELDLVRMKSIKKPTQSFSLAQKLIKIYIDILK